MSEIITFYKVYGRIKMSENIQSQEQKKEFVCRIVEKCGNKLWHFEEKDDSTILENFAKKNNNR